MTNYTITKRVHRHIEVKAALLVKVYRCDWSEKADFMQEMYLGLLSVMPHFEPCVSVETFMIRVVDKIACRLAGRKVRKPDPLALPPADVIALRDAEGDEAFDGAAFLREAFNPVEDFAREDNYRALRWAIASLEEPYATIGRAALRTGLCPHQLGKRLGYQPSSFNTWYFPQLLKRLRRHLTRCYHRAGRGLAGVWIATHLRCSR